MAVSIVDSKIAGAGAAGASLSVNFTLQPTNGKPWIVGAACYFPDSIGQLSVSAPTGLTPRQDLDAGGNVAALLYTKNSSGSDGTTSTVTKTGDNETFAIFAATLDGTSGYDTSGKATTNSATSLAISTDGSVATDGSLAIAIIFKQSGTHTCSMSGWALLTEVRTTTASRTEALVYTKTVNSGAAASGTFTLDSGLATRIKGFIVVYTPSASGPPTATMVKPSGDASIFEGDTVILEGSATGGATPYKNWAWNVVEGGSGTTPGTTQTGTMAFPTAGTWTLQLTVDGDDDQTSDPVMVTITVTAASSAGAVISPLSVKGADSFSQIFIITLENVVLTEASDATSIGDAITLGGLFAGLNHDQVSKINSRQFSLRIYGTLTTTSGFGTIELDESEVESE